MSIQHLNRQPCQKVSGVLLPQVVVLVTLIGQTAASSSIVSLTQERFYPRAWSRPSLKPEGKINVWVWRGKDRGKSLEWKRMKESLRAEMPGDQMGQVESGPLAFGGIGGWSISQHALSRCVWDHKFMETVFKWITTADTCYMGSLVSMLFTNIYIKNGYYCGKTSLHHKFKSFTLLLIF